jgi:hypothetical protein
MSAPGCGARHLNTYFSSSAFVPLLYTHTHLLLLLLISPPPEWSRRGTAGRRKINNSVLCARAVVAVIFLRVFFLLTYFNKRQRTLSIKFSFAADGPTRERARVHVKGSHYRVKHCNI